MKWGVRRFQNKDGSLTPAGEKRYESQSGEKKAAGSSVGSVTFRPKRLSQMSDDELKKEISRLKLEQQYKALKTGGMKRAVEKGASIVSKFMDYSIKKKEAAANKIEQERRYKAEAEERKLREKELNVRLKEAEERTKQSANDIKRAEQVTKQNEALAKREASIAKEYGTRAKRLEMKSELKRAKSEVRGVGVGRKKIALLKQMFKKDSDKFADAINAYYGVKPNDKDKNKK